MKKFLLSIALLTSGFAALAQNLTMSQNWLVRTGDANGTTLSLANTASIAYNKSNNKLYVADRNTPKISILELDNANFNTYSIAATGLKTNTLTLGSFRFNKIRVADDGAIYATSLFAATTANAAGTVYVYRWENEADQAPKSFALSVEGRIGDSFAVYGTGVNTKIYISGSSVSPNFHKRIYVCQVDASGDVSYEKTVTITADGQARGSISAISGNELLINSSISGIGPRKITVNGDNTVTVDAVVSTTTVSTDYSNAEYFVDGSKKYMAIYGAIIGSNVTNNKGLDLNIYDVTTSFVNPTLTTSSRLFPLPENPTASSNTSGYADIAVRKNADGTHTFFHVVFGSGLASYTTVGTLPVSLTAFNASLVKGQSTLTWETASETNNKGFEVLRSTDGKEFSKIDFVNAKGQNGNSSTALSYSYVDRTAKAGTNYYQLNQVDLDGKTELFKDIKSVNVGLASGVTVFPNPATTYVSVNAGSADFKGVKYELFDANGKKLLSEKAKAEQQDISLSKLPASVYYLKISKNNVLQNTVKLIKQ
ncbi:MAG: T9SS type A sorting domain-containing protein [Chitinophagaceae bacterium]|nr:MAG: T9SS type A sorting domain-containing protein [Chitinophagaceae bacterium]